MQETANRAISGILYVIIMLLGSSYSNFSCSLLFIVLGIISIYEMWKLRIGKNKIIPLLYIVIPFSLIQILCFQFEGNWKSNLILFMLILTFTFDTFAYLIGVKYGKNKIIPSISPKKSWEGFTGGFIFTIIISYIISQYIFIINMNLAIILSLTLPFTATIGDFIESKYKREAKVKDSGNIIPGHGGILDRMDALMITIPTIYILTNYFK